MVKHPSPQLLSYALFYILILLVGLLYYNNIYILYVHKMMYHKVLYINYSFKILLQVDLRTIPIVREVNQYIINPVDKF
jgi:hypothetical protein